MTKLQRWLLIVLVAAFTTSSTAEEAAQDQSSDTASASAGKAERPPAGAKPSPEVFVPTEEISEDFAVSFPVDI